MKSLYKMNLDCGRHGNLQGIFTAEDEDVEILIKHEIEVHFGEVLGKHSDVGGYIPREEITKITNDEKVIELFEQYQLQSGYNPFDYSLRWEEANELFPDNPDDRMVQEAVDYYKETKNDITKN